MGIAAAAVAGLAGCGKKTDGSETADAGGLRDAGGQQEIVEWDEYTGRLAAPSRVEVRARVSGFLQSVHFKDGDMVRTALCFS